MQWHEEVRTAESSAEAQDSICLPTVSLRDLLKLEAAV